jgi:hypothetical protein
MVKEKHSQKGIQAQEGIASSFDHPSSSLF